MFKQFFYFYLTTISQPQCTIATFTNCIFLFTVFPCFVLETPERISLLFGFCRKRFSSSQRKSFFFVSINNCCSCWRSITIAANHWFCLLFNIAHRNDCYTVSPNKTITIRRWGKQNWKVSAISVYFYCINEKWKQNLPTKVIWKYYLFAIFVVVFEPIFSSSFSVKHCFEFSVSPFFIFVFL